LGVRRAYRVWGRMRRAWLSVKLRCALAWRALFIDLGNFLLIEHRRVGGFLISGKNSGTHWLRFMLSHAMARRYGVRPPVHSSGRDAEVFIGNPRNPRTHPQLPFIACSHNLPSRFLRWRWLRWLFDIPPIVVLVRDPKEAMLSHFVKWREPMRLTLHDYVHKATTKRRILANAWWYIDFFNRWGRMAESAPDEVLVVPYEALKAAPAFWLRRISAHLGLGLDDRAIEAALAVSSHEAIRATLDPAYGEAIVPDAAERARMRFPPAENAALDAQFAAHMHHDFGYGYADRLARGVDAARLPWAKAGFLVAVAYAIFNQVGRPYFGLNLGEPWGHIELIGVFTALTLLAPWSFPKLKLAFPAVLSVGGGVVEWAQHFRLAPGVGSLTDLTAEVGGIAAAVGLMLAAFAASLAQQARSESTVSASRASPAEAARPERHPR
jgi:Sulfotransferase family